MSSKIVGTVDAPSEREPIHMGFVIAWLFCAAFYFMQYMLRSAPGVMVPELSAAFARDALGVGALVGLYYYTYALFSIVFGALLDRFGGKAVIPVGIVLVAVGAALFGLGSMQAAQIGRLLQGAGSACGFIGAVYLATRGFPPRSLATAVRFRSPQPAGFRPARRRPAWPIPIRQKAADDSGRDLVCFGLPRRVRRSVPRDQ